MNENVGQFRSVTFGGFHRQDVLDYIQTLTQESQDTIKTLTSQLEEAQAAKRSLEQELQTLTQTHRETENQRRSLEEELSRCKAQTEQQGTALSAAEAEAGSLRSRVAELEPGAAAWQRLKSTAGDIEVSAHERAQTIIQEAQVQAAEIHAEGVRWVLEIQEHCDRLQKKMSASFQAVENEMQTVRQACARSEQDMDGFQHALSELATIAEPEPDTVPKPETEAESEH